MNEADQAEKIKLQISSSQPTIDIENSAKLHVKWNKDTFQFELPESATILNLKRMLYERTRVLPNRQKLVGLKLASFVIDDSVKIGELLVKSRVSELKFMMVGTPENEIFVYEEEKQGADLVNDLDYDYSGSGAAGGDSEKEYILKIDPSVQEKLEFVIGNSEIALINPPRRGKKLLVLDLDYTLFDMKGAPESGNYMDLKRPYTDELLKAVYPFYDIVIWSQTSWRWLEIKLTELGILTNPNYKIAFVLDKTTMFTVEGARISKSTGKPKSHQVKPLELIWRKFPDYYSSKTTIHIDDLSRNFALNPSNGLKIRAFKDAELTRTNDFELLLLTRYLLLIAELEDFSELTHKYWKKYIQQHAL